MEWGGANGFCWGKSASSRASCALRQPRERQGLRLEHLDSPHGAWRLVHKRGRVDNTSKGLGVRISDAAPGQGSKDLVPTPPTANALGSNLKMPRLRDDVSGLHLVRRTSSKLTRKCQTPRECSIAWWAGAACAWQFSPAGAFAKTEDLGGALVLENGSSDFAQTLPQYRARPS